MSDRGGEGRLGSVEVVAGGRGREAVLRLVLADGVELLAHVHEHVHEADPEDQVGRHEEGPVPIHVDVPGGDFPDVGDEDGQADDE